MQEKPCTRSYKYQNTDSNHATHTHTHTTAHTRAHASKLSHTHKRNAESKIARKSARDTRKSKGDKENAALKQSVAK